MKSIESGPLRTFKRGSWQVRIMLTTGFNSQHGFDTNQRHMQLYAVVKMVTEDAMPVYQIYRSPKHPTDQTDMADFMYKAYARDTVAAAIKRAREELDDTIRQRLKGEVT